MLRLSGEGFRVLDVDLHALQPVVFVHAQPVGRADAGGERVERVEADGFDAPAFPHKAQLGVLAADDALGNDFECIAEQRLGKPLSPDLVLDDLRHFECEVGDLEFAVGLDDPLQRGGYRAAALERIELALPLDESAITTMQSPKAAPKVAFGALVETGWIKPGTVLCDRKRRMVALVRADGSLDGGAQCGSIHSLGAKLQGAPSCNGWSFWHIEHEGELKPIDTIRQLYLLATED